jgi:small subunit ribosomal protein S20
MLLPEVACFTKLPRFGIVSSVMPIIKSAIKRVRQQTKRRSRNLQVKRAVHQDVRSFSDAIITKDASQISVTLREAISEIDRAVKKGALHRNTAARRKSSLQKQANTSGVTLTADPKKTTTTTPKKAAPKTNAKKATPAKKPAVKKTSTK